MLNNASRTRSGGVSFKNSQIFSISYAKQVDIFGVFKYNKINIYF